MQTLMAERNHHLPAERAMQFRLGIHMGDVIADEDEVFGDDVNIAVRLEAVASPGGVAISAKAYQEASKHLTVAAGRCRQPSLQEHQGPDRGLDLAARGFAPAPGPNSGRRRRPAGAVSHSDRRRAALRQSQRRARRIFLRRPDRGPDPRAVAAILLSGAEPQLDLRVQGQEPEHPPDRARDRRDLSDPGLGAARRTKIRVTAELIAPETGEQLWTGRYDRDIGELFAMQDEITTNLSAAIATEIYRAEASAPARPSSTDVTAWDRFLKGLSHYYRQTKDDVETSVGLFHEAIALDPTLSIAHAYLATIQIQGIQFGWIKGTREMWAEAMALAETSVRLDPRSSFAFSILAYAHATEAITRPRWTPPSARSRSTPTTTAHAACSASAISSSASTGERSNCSRWPRSSDNSDPRYQWAALNAFSHYLLGQYDASLSWAREQLYVNPNHLQALAIRAAALAQSGRNAEAEARPTACSATTRR